MGSQALLRMREQISGERRYASCKNNWNSLSPDDDTSIIIARGWMRGLTFSSRSELQLRN
jgi:hypothetical protein